ncbi:glycosyltransferase [Neisseria shayeganii]|uniref:Glycosyltransferase n=1 Tax=Neisseria shayeganii TaxID=607712 RepID=A0A7D7SH98_9NEIS|nr:glycosyltransferase [Neisseria shayeganii]QMT40692.1 glycosyltransferase [Neisseria shayeganii]
MKILIAHQWLVAGGVEKILTNYLKLMVKLGHQVDLLLTHDLGAENFFTDQIPTSVSYRFVFDSAYNRRKADCKKQRKNSILNRVRYEYLRLIEQYRYWRTLRQTLTTGHYDIVIDFNESLDYIMRLPKPLRPKLPPSIRWVHNQLNGCHSKLTPKQIHKYRIIFQRHNRVVVLCRQMAELMGEQLNWKPERFHILPNPLDIEEITAQMEKSGNLTKQLLQTPYLLQVSRFEPQKCHQRLIEIYATLKQYGIKHKLYLIGDGSLKPQLETQIRRLGLEHDCLLLGQCHNPYPFFKHAALFVHTASFEGLPTVLLESMACGTPVVAMDCPTGPRDILGRGSEYGCLIAMYQQQQFVEAVSTLLTDPTRYAHYVEAGRKRAQDFSIQSITTQLQKLLQETVSA